MTVCIAAIYNNNSILGISDRMITAGDIKFEPPASKIANITNSIAILTAGDASIQTRLFEIASPIISERIKQHPEKWVAVSDVADLYRDIYINLRAGLAEKAILSLYKLDYESFISRQKEMSQEFINDVSYKLGQFSIEAAHTIITGIDETGPHIFVVINDYISCADRVGFAAVGIGSNHAISHFMLSGYAKSTLESKALLTIHQAKKKSESSPGVGQDTDMFVLGPNLGTFNIFDSGPGVDFDIIKDMDGFYSKYINSIDRLDKKTEEKIKNYIQSITVKTAPTQQGESLETETTTEGATKKAISRKP